MGKRGDDDNQATHELPEPTSDHDASLWWRAHATQSHFGYAHLLAARRRQDVLRRLKISVSNDDVDNNENQSEMEQQCGVITPEMVANPALYALYQDALERLSDHELRTAAEQRRVEREQDVQRLADELEAQIARNTRRLADAQREAERAKARVTVEQRAATTIQRVVRGQQGRRLAKEHRATYFVMVRGRAIRKGKCEECGEQRAVLECRECDESLHFCPNCWVQVHATRRRKLHVALPMAMTGVEEKERNGAQEKQQQQQRRALEPLVVEKEPTVRVTGRKGVPQDLKVNVNDVDTSERVKDTKVVAREETAPPKAVTRVIEGQASVEQQPKKKEKKEKTRQEQSTDEETGAEASQHQVLEANQSVVVLSSTEAENANKPAELTNESEHPPPSSPALSPAVEQEQPMEAPVDRSTPTEDKEDTATMAPSAQDQTQPQETTEQTQQEGNSTL
ncbi:hypothetical protein PINS_up010386 [Pythium insidiosum]|nr:hypothetical protein PINS_up010386 [Pythium insidiosum]